MADTFSKDAVLYCRVSLKDQDCDRQVRDLTEYAQRLGYNVIQVFKETASGTANDRRLRKAVMTLAQQRKISAVLVTELSRWGRSTQDLLTTVQQLADCGVSLVAQNGMTFDLSTAQGKLLLTVLSGISQFERDLLSERTKSGMAATEARGTKLGRPTGNRTDAKHRKAVMALREQNFSIAVIASKLKIGKDTVSRILACSN